MRFLCSVTACRGNNKGFIGNKLAVIDPGHSLKHESTMRTEGIYSDFSYDMPKNWNIAFLQGGFRNFTVFEDRPYHEKMQGVKILKELKERGKDLEIFDEYLKMFDGKILGEQLNFKDQIQEIKNHYIARRNFILNIFEQRLSYIDKPIALDFLDNLEKLTSDTDIYSKKTLKKPKSKLLKYLMIFGGVYIAGVISLIIIIPIAGLSWIFLGLFAIPLFFLLILYFKAKADEDKTGTKVKLNRLRVKKGKRVEWNIRSYEDKEENVHFVFFSNFKKKSKFNKVKKILDEFFEKYPIGKLAFADNKIDIDILENNLLEDPFSVHGAEFMIRNRMNKLNLKITEKFRDISDDSKRLELEGLSFFMTVQQYIKADRIDVVENFKRDLENRLTYAGYQEDLERIVDLLDSLIENRVLLKELPMVSNSLPQDLPSSLKVKLNSQNIRVLAMAV